MFTVSGVSCTIYFTSLRNYGTGRDILTFNKAHSSFKKWLSYGKVESREIIKFGKAFI